MSETFQPNQIVYCQGRYACRVVADRGASIDFVALEGYGSEHHKDKQWSAAKDLFTTAREVRRPRAPDFTERYVSHLEELARERFENDADSEYGRALQAGAAALRLVGCASVVNERSESSASTPER